MIGVTEGFIIALILLIVFIGVYMYIYGHEVKEPKEGNEKKKFIEENIDMLDVEVKKCINCKKTKPLKDFPLKEYESAIRLRLSRPDIFDGRYNKLKT